MGKDHGDLSNVYGGCRRNKDMVIKENISGLLLASDSHGQGE